MKRQKARRRGVILLTAALSILFYTTASANEPKEWDGVVEVEVPAITELDKNDGGQDLLETQKEEVVQSLPQKPISDEVEFKAQESVKIEQTNNVLESKLDHKSRTRASYNSDPNSAIYIDPSYFGYMLSDTADQNEGWYYFYANQTEKVTAFLSQPSGADYDIYLYQLEGSALNLVSYSEYSSPRDEQLSYVSTQGAYYFLRVVPYSAPATTSTYDFVIMTTTEYDTTEGDDNAFFAKTYTNSIITDKDIDNVLDEDWYKLVVESSYKNGVMIGLDHVPSGAVYNVTIYDQNLNALTSFNLNSSGVEEISITGGIYYVRMYMVSGSVTNSAYQVATEEAYDKKYILNFNSSDDRAYTSYKVPLYYQGKIVFESMDLSNFENNSDLVVSLVCMNPQCGGYGRSEADARFSQLYENGKWEMETWVETSQHYKILFINGTGDSMKLSGIMKVYRYR